MVVVHRDTRARGPRGRRLAALAVLLVAFLLFVAGALAQRSGALSGAAETLSRLFAAVTHPREIIDAAIDGIDLPKLSIDVKFADMQTIEARREEALHRGLLLTSGDDFVPASLRVNEDTLRAKIRLKGDILDHIVTSKWSFRVHMRGDDRFQGMRRFSIQHPKTRFFLHEWGFLETMRAEGILAPRYGFARVVLNGQSKGIYAVEEAFATELMESQQRRAGLLLRLDENPFHAWFHDQPEHPGPGVDVAPVSDRNVAVEPFDGGGIRKNEALAIQWARARTLLTSYFRDGETPASRVFDAPLLGRFLAVCELWGASHPLRWGNVRFYYNPLTDRIEPVAYDGSIAVPGGTGGPRLRALSSVREGLPGAPWTLRALDDPAVVEAYLSTLNRILDPAYVADLEKRLGDRWNEFAVTLRGEFPGEICLATPWATLATRAGWLAQALAPRRHVLALLSRRGREGESLRLEAASVLALPVEVTALIVDGARVAVTARLPGCLPDEAPRFTEIPLPSAPATSVSIVTRIVGMSGTLTAEARHVPAASGVGIPLAPTTERCLELHPFLERADAPDSLRVRAGTWDVDGDLVLPDGVRLTAGPGTTLRFQKDALLLARGPVDLRGSADAPVILSPRPSSKRWLGLVVLDAHRLSTWSHVRLSGTSGVARRGWVLTSGVTFHLSPIRMTHCVFANHRGLDDQLNVFRSAMELRGCELGNCSGDAIDGDFVEGLISGCSFHDVGGDAIDFSGSDVTVERTVLRNIEDKGISAGERSVVRVEDLRCDGASIAVASKDGSRVDVRGATVTDARFALAAYRKKPEYAPGTITATGLVLKDVVVPTVVQTGSRIVLDGKPIGGSDLDVKRLYEEGVLGK
jgi:Right handed beta helix region